MKAAVLGYGTVGVGVYDMLKASESLEAGPVLVRKGKENESFKVSDLSEITGDSSVKAVAEVMGGIEPAFSYARAAIEAGKHFVTSNKALVAAHGIELDRLAREKGVSFLFSAACGGGVPFLHNLAIASENDAILSVGGILNGTTNYMLDSMQSSGKDYSEALKEAQALGYAEADPTADVSGLDALRKIMLACAVAWDALPVSGLLNEGIDSLTAADVAHFKSMGLTCRLLANGAPAGDTVCAYVEPVLFKNNAPECSVLKNFNMAKYEAVNAGRIVLMGQGAGRKPTASAVIRDLSAVEECGHMLRACCREVCADNSGAVHRYYVRMPEGVSADFALKKICSDGECVRAFTEPVSVEKMHAFAAEIRKEGAGIFFAALDE